MFFAWTCEPYGEHIDIMVACNACAISLDLLAVSKIQIKNSGFNV